MALEKTAGGGAGFLALEKTAGGAEIQFYRSTGSENTVYSTTGTENTVYSTTGTEKGYPLTTFYFLEPTKKQVTR